MTWLAPLAAGIVALSTIPPLVALYFLRLRRTRRVVSSTLLWKRATEDLHANTPFQRIRFSLLLLLQLLALALVVLAIAQPQADMGERSAARIVFLIDRSGSMGTQDMEGGTTRLEEAKRRAVARIRQLHGGGLFSGPAPSVMVIAFAREAEVIAPFTTNAAQLTGAIESIVPTDETTKIADGFELARAFTTVTNPDDASATPAEPPSYEIFSDGLVADVALCALRPGERVVYRPVAGEQQANAGLGALAAARTPDHPDEVEVYARVINWGHEIRRTDLELRVDGSIRAVTPRPVEVPARSVATGSTVVAPGESQVVFPSIALPSGGLLTVRLLEGDALPADDRASVIAPPQEALTVALVGRGSFVLRSILGAMGLATLDAFSVDEWNSKIDADSGTPDQYDAIVLDGVAPNLVRRGRYLIFGPPPPIEGIVPYGSKSNAIVRGSREGHPLLEFVNLDELFVASMHAVAGGADADAIVEASEGPLVLTVQRGPLTAVYLTFDPMESNWPFQRGFVNFVANSIRWLASGGASVTDEPLTPGDVAAARVPAGAAKVTWRSADGSTEALTVGSGSEVSFGPLRTSGVHEIAWEGPANPAGARAERVAVNMNSREEGSVQAAESLDFASERVAGVVGGGERLSALWPWLLLAALAVLLLEWWVWLRRV